ncbi:DUF7536 family protein [Halobaculum sp. D14]|uniref:DUF7536 family protein n=1 Tax=Halobaculum sp. D14 TaxID=3421642 RepID=UPI003EBF2870
MSRDDHGADPAATDERPERPPADGLADALSLRRNVAVGVATGVLLAAATYLVRVFELLGPFVGTRDYPVLGAEGYFLLLAFVLAATTALLVTTLLALRSAVGLVREDRRTQ